MPFDTDPCTIVAVLSPLHSEENVKPGAVVTGCPLLVTGILRVRELNADNAPFGAGVKESAPTTRGAAPILILTEPAPLFAFNTAVALMLRAPAELKSAGLMLIVAIPVLSVNAEPETGVNCTNVVSLAMNFTIALASGAPIASENLARTIAVCPPEILEMAVPLPSTSVTTSVAAVALTEPEPEPEPVPAPRPIFPGDPPPPPHAANATAIAVPTINCPPDFSSRLIMPIFMSSSSTNKFYLTLN